MIFNSRGLKHLYTFLVIIFFMVLAIGSAQVNKIHCGAFSTFSTGEDQKNENYVEMIDGTKVYGESVSWKSGLVVKDQIKIDNKPFKIKETRGYFSNGNYYATVGNTYMKRIVHGKINVYYDSDLVTYTSTDSQGRMRTTTRTVCSHYAQKGDDGPIVPIADQGDIKKFVQDCPISVEMIDKSNKEVRRSIKKNSFYLNQIFVTYNNGCK